TSNLSPSSSDDGPALFDLCEWFNKGGLDWKYWFKDGNSHIRRDDISSWKTQDTHRQVLGRVVQPRWDYQRLLADQPAPNAQWGSYLNGARLSRTLQRHCSLNIPREMIELRDNMLTNMKHDFGQDEQKVA